MLDCCNCFIIILKMMMMDNVNFLLIWIIFNDGMKINVRTKTINEFSIITIVNYNYLILLIIDSNWFTY